MFFILLVKYFNYNFFQVIFFKQNQNLINLTISGKILENAQKCSDLIPADNKKFMVAMVQKVCFFN